MARRREVAESLMFNSIARWLGMKWRPRHIPSILRAYHATFSGEYGALVLQDLIDNIYCTVYEGVDPNAALIHNARRSVVHYILENVDRAENPLKYDIMVETVETEMR